MYPSHFYWGSSQGVFTFANMLPYLFIQISDIPEKATLPATMQCLLIVIVFYHLLMLIHVSLHDHKNFLNCLSFTVLIGIFWTTQRKRKKKYVVPYYLWMRKIILICHERCCCLMSVVIFNHTKQYRRNKSMNYLWSLEQYFLYS